MSLDSKTALAAFITITARDLRDIDRETRSRINAAQGAIDKLREVLGPLPAPGAQTAVHTTRAREIEWSADVLARLGLEFAALAARCRDVGERQNLLTQLPTAADR